METNIFCLLLGETFSPLIFAYIFNTCIVLFFSFFLRGKFKELNNDEKVKILRNPKMRDWMIIIPSIFVGIVNLLCFGIPTSGSPFGSFLGMFFLFFFSIILSLLVIIIFFSEQSHINALLFFAYLILLFGILIPPFSLGFSIPWKIITLISAIVVASISYKIGTKYQVKLSDGVETNTTKGEYDYNNNEILTEGFKKAQKTIMEDGSTI